MVIPLQQLCRLAGWSHSSPLGLDIHPHFGTWFACRAAFLIQAPLEPTSIEGGASPCEDCSDKPCRSACPADAVQPGKTFSLDACVGHRLQPQSSCASQCLARSVCPAGAGWRYTEEQIRYHGQQSLASLRRIKFHKMLVGEDSN